MVVPAIFMEIQARDEPTHVIANPSETDIEWLKDTSNGRPVCTNAAPHGVQKIRDCTWAFLERSCVHLLPVNIRAALVFGHVSLKQWVPW